VAVGAAVAISTIGLAIPAQAATYSVNFGGTVECSNGQPVEGVWVQSSAGGSRWAGWFAFPGKADAAFYSTTLTTLAPNTWVTLHVGCGGSTSSWRSNLLSGWVWVKGGQQFTVNMQCNAASAGRQLNACTPPPLPAAYSLSGPDGDPGYCTWGADTKWKEATGYWPNIHGNAKDLDEDAARKGFRVTSAPSRRAMIVKNTADKWGHVAWVRDIKLVNGVVKISVTEMNGGSVMLDRKNAITNEFNRFVDRDWDWNPSLHTFIPTGR
jgi:hypothetical protein